MASSDDNRLRLEMLSMRAQLQRMELHQQVQEVRQSLSWGKLLVSGAQRLMQSRSWVQGSAMAQQFVTQYPMLAMLGSAGFGLFRKPILRLGVRMAVFGAIGGAAWWYWKSHQMPTRAPVDVNPLTGSTGPVPSPDGQTAPRLGSS
jgi:hypothetical protein